jgi:chromosome partitioning protein
MNPKQKTTPYRLAFTHKKGGTGKTTACLNVAGWLASQGYQVLVVDLDPQGSATAGLGLQRDTLEHTLYELFIGTAVIENCVYETSSGIFLLPSAPELQFIDDLLVPSVEHGKDLLYNLDGIASNFDFILFDTPAGHKLLLISAMLAAGNLAIAMDSGVFSLESLDTLAVLIEETKRVYDCDISPNMVLVKQEAMFAGGNTQQEMFRLINDFWNEQKIDELLIYKIPYSSKVRGSQMSGMTLAEFSPNSKVAKVFKVIAEQMIEIRRQMSESKE